MNKILSLPTPTSVLLKVRRMKLQEPIGTKEIDTIDSLLDLVARGMDENPEAWSDVHEALMEKYDEAKVLLGITKSMEKVHQEQYATT